METTFNKYGFLTDLQDFLKSEAQSGNLENMDKAYTLINQYIDTECIYYTDCFDICKELNATHFDGYENITDLAIAALTEFVEEKIDLHELQDLINDNK